MTAFVPTPVQQQILDILKDKGPQPLKNLQRKFQDWADFVALQRGKAIGYNTDPATKQVTISIYSPRPRAASSPVTAEEKEQITAAIKAVHASGKAARMKSICEQRKLDHKDLMVRGRTNVVLRALQEDGAVVKVHTGSNFQDSYLPV